MKAYRNISRAKYEEVKTVKAIKLYSSYAKAYIHIE